MKYDNDGYPDKMKPDPYPIPDSSAPIYIVGDRLMLILIGPSGAGHTIAIPTTAEGMKLLKQILDARRSALHERLCSPAAPTQYQVDKLLEQARPKVEDKFTDEQRQGAREILRKMGLV